MFFGMPSAMTSRGLLVTSLAVTCLCAALTSESKVKFGVILPYNGTQFWVMRKVLPAIEYALESVTKKGWLPGRTLEVNRADSQCSETEGPLAAIEMYHSSLAHVFLGPACNYAIAPVARFSHRWGIPVLTAGAFVRAFHDKSEYKLLTRILGTYDKSAHFFITMFKEFAWHQAGLLFYENLNLGPNAGKTECFFAMEGIYEGIKKNFNKAPYAKKFDERDPSISFRDLLVEASKNARIIVLCASPESVREIMIQAHDLNFDNGEYVFINIDLFNSHNMTSRPWHRDNDTESRNSKARQAYESLMTVTLRKPTSPEYRKFSNLVKKRAEKNYPNFTYGEDEVNSFVGAFHDAVILYALALNETLAAGGEIKDGAAITRRMWNRTFEGITGTVSIDENGDRNADFSLLDLNPESDTFEVVANYYGNRKKYEPVKGRKIHWAGGRNSPPPDEPECGFDGSKCPPDEPFPEYAIVIIVLGSLLLVVLVITFFVYRHLRLEAELAAMNWRVRWDDILLGNPAKNPQLENRQGENEPTHPSGQHSSCNGANAGRRLLSNDDDDDNETVVVSMEMLDEGRDARVGTRSKYKDVTTQT